MNTIRLGNSRANQRLRIVGAVILAGWLVMAGAVQAESPWRRLARAISPNAQAPVKEEAALRQGPAGGPLTLQQQAELEAYGQMAEVPDEFSSGTLPGSYAPVNATLSQGITGLAVGSRGASQAINLGLESEDNPMFAVNLFKDPEILRMLGDEPRFVYDPGDRPDPMLLPWVRNLAIYTELSTKAEVMVASGEYAAAVGIYQQIMGLNDPRFSMSARGKIDEIMAMQNAADAQALASVVDTQVVVELPSWVEDNTTGIVADGQSNLCLVGDFMLRPGDSVPNYPEVLVATVGQGVVTYQVQNETFEVALKDEE